MSYFVLNNIDTIIFKLISKKIKIKDFEKWVYSEKKLEKLITPNDFLELISLRYTTPSALYDAEKILKKYINIGKYYEWELRKTLQQIIDRPSNVHEYIAQCYDLYCDGYYFLENLGLGYGLGIEVPPASYSAQSWNKLTPKDQIILIESYYPQVKKEAKKVIYWLDSKEILLTGHNGEYQGIEYNDNRKNIF